MTTFTDEHIDKLKEFRINAYKSVTKGKYLSLNDLSIARANRSALLSLGMLLTFFPNGLLLIMISINNSVIVWSNVALIVIPSTVIGILILLWIRYKAINYERANYIVDTMVTIPPDIINILDMKFNIKDNQYPLAVCDDMVNVIIRIHHTDKMRQEIQDVINEIDKGYTNGQ